MGIGERSETRGKGKSRGSSGVQVGKKEWRGEAERGLQNMC